MSRNVYPIFLLLAIGVACAADDLDVIRKQLSSADAKTRADAVTQAGKTVEHAKELTDLIIPLLKDPDPDVRYASVRVLGDFKAINAVDVIIPVLEDSDHDVAGMAAFVLAWEDA